MAKNVIIMIGDGMGWEMTRASAIQLIIEEQIEQYKAENPSATNQEIFDQLFAGDTLQDADYYTEGAGFGTSYHTLEGYVISTTGNTYIDGDKGNSALQGDPFDHNTGQAPIREGFEFNPDPALVEGFFEELRDQGFDEDAILDEDGNIRGGNVPIFNLEKGGESPWDSDYYENRDNPDEGFDKEYIKNLYPDSAGTATGLYTGVKTYVGAIAVDIFEETVETTAERALSTGKSVGVVSSVPFNHATPAAAIAHVNQRNKTTDESVTDELDEFGHPIEDTDNIFRQIVDEVKPTVVLGGGHPDGRGDERYVTYEELEKLRNGEYDYEFVERAPGASETLAETASEIDPDAGERLFGIYGARGQGGNLPWRGADSDYSEAGTVRDEGRPRTERPLEEGETDEEFIAREVDENPTLQELTEATLDVLEDDNEGFWMMVESGDIDWSAHDNDMDAMLGTLKDFDDSVRSVQEWIAENGGYEENLLIVTADHDHYLTLNDNFPEVVAEALLLGEGGLELTMNDDPNESGHFWGSDPDVKYGWGTHTSRPVPVYFQGPSEDEAFLQGFLGDGYEAYGTEVEGVGTYIDQVHLGLTQLNALSEELPTATLVGFSSLPADTFEPGLPGGSGNSISSDNRDVPFDEQPVQGFSGVQFAEDGNYWFLSDNGYGSKANSDDYLLRIFKVDPNFQTEDGGTGEAEVLDFIQLSDPNDLIPFDIVQEGTTERLLTGADFDIESIVIAEDGSIWIGEEFGPYLLHFNADGELIDAPFATPNIYDFNTLDGEDPLVIAHRGASGDRPEHTAGFLSSDLVGSYNLGIRFGADFIEPDLVPTKDGVLIARHENALAIVETDENGNPMMDENGDYVIAEATTNVHLLPQFSDLLTTKVVDGRSYTGWFSEDFTLAEIKQLRALERIPEIRPDNTDYDFFFEIPTLEEIIDLVNEIEATTGEQIGIYPETKHPTYFAEEGSFIDGSPININTSQILIDTLVEKGFTDPDRIFIQSFEVSNLKDLSENIMPEAGVDIPLVQLIGGGGAPYDLEASGDGRTYSDLITPDGLAEIATYADGIGPSKRRIVGTSDNELLEPTTLVEDAHEAGLQVHPYTFRDEDVFLADDYNGNPEAEYDQFYSLGVDGLFSDNPDTARLVLDKITAEFVSSPDNPENAEFVNLSRSRGYEGLGYSPDLMTLYPMLEGRVMGDPENALRIYEFDVASESFADELAGYYELADGSHAIGDMTPINDNEFIVIERDGNQGEEAAFKKLFKVDLSQVDENGFVEKTELVDLLNIADPDDLNNDGETFFSFPFVTIEDVLVLDEQTLLVANDNNYPFSIGRGPDIDNNEIIQIQLDEPLDVDPRVGVISEVGLSVDKTTVSEDGETYTLTFTLDEAAPEGGLRVVWSEVDSDNAFGDIEFPPTLTNASNLEQLTPEDGELARSAITIDEGATSATITLTTVADEVTEGDETTTYTLIDEIGYAPTDDSSVTVTIEDTSMAAPAVPMMVRGSSDGDFFDTENPGDAEFMGDNQILFAGSGDDFVDVSLAPGGSRSRIDLGSGDDIIFAGSNNRILAGSGDDMLFLDSGEGNNIVTGGSGMDQFWLVTDAEALPANPNTITDFTIGKDVIGFGATDLSFDDLMLTQNGADTTLNALGQDLAILRQIESSDLSAADFVFA
ncbi:glycerophosphoryl diester phosphodiesterase [Crocosphaera chwakensis CCY0110]|uniref:Glycerophosphoryl diester phosphodiesterase n=1 Tax=Crocosphaera chwakensis CCY0110 TaxID=391612 RepID=A3ITD9_9CHRO|nr:glycerophosphoryl diester phosphodiesterase [Crocosphaera chwakensis CCY0110]